MSLAPSNLESPVTKHDQAAVDRKQRCENSLTVFVRISTQNSRTLPLRLSGLESLEQLQRLVQKAARLPGDSLATLTLRGHSLTRVSQLRSNDTIVATVGGLRGGSAFAILQCEGYEDVPVFNKTATVQNIMDAWSEVNPSTKKRPFFDTFVVNDIPVVLPLEDEDERMKILNKEIVDLDHANGDIIQVIRVAKAVDDDKKATQSLPEDEQFIKRIPCFGKQVAIDALKKLLSDKGPEQRYLMANFVKRQMEEEDLNLILTTMTNDQIDNLLLVFQADKDYKMKILKYLLKKANQWTAISSTMNKNASEATKTLQIRRLINGMKNTFDPSDENDSIITQLLYKEQGNMLDQIIVNMSNIQRIELLMNICDEEQRPKVIECLREKDVKEFWPLLSKERRMEIFAKFTPPEKMKFMVSTEILTDDLKIRLWDNIGKENRLEMWRSCKEFGVLEHCRTTDEENLQPQKQILELEKRLLSSITVAQRSRLWSNLISDEQTDLLKHVVDTESNSVEFWNTLDHDKRCLLVSQLDDKDILKLFTSMDLENRTSIYMMLNMDYRKKCESILTADEKEELFLFGHFEEREFTQNTSKEFIDNLVRDYYSQNNQVVPFDKIEGGYVQCIANPQVQNGFITVQIVEPRYKVDNTNITLETGFEDKQFYSDEARQFGQLKDQHNDQFRFTQNLYGQLQETDPNLARNSQELAIISFFEYSQDMGIQCTHSFFAQNPVKFMRNGKTSSELVLFSGLSGDVFFFNKKSTGAHSNAVIEDNNFDLCLQVLNKRQNADRGELSRETSESCFTYRINPSSNLFDLVMNGRFVMKKYTEVYHLNSVPTMVESKYDKFIVFSHCKTDDQGPALYFYDVNAGKEIKRVLGGEAIIDYHEHDSLEDGKGRVMVLGNKEIMGDKIWSSDTAIKKSYAEKYDACVEPERRAAIVFSIIIDLHDEDADYDVLKPSGDVLIKEIPKSNDKDKGVPNADMAQWIPSIEAAEQVITLDLKDDDKNFSQRYLRQTPAQFYPHDRDKNTGKILSFTILFYDLYAYTFSFLTVDGNVSEETRTKTQKEVDKVNAEIKQMIQDGDKDGTLQTRLADKEDQKKKLWEDAIPKLHYYKCKYLLPEASSVVYDQRVPGFTKTFIQVSNRNERAQQKAHDNLRDVNQFELSIHNISDSRIKPDAVERQPNDSESRKIKVPMSRAALEAYAKNLYANKFGECFIRSLATPVLFHQAAYAGGFLYMKKEGFMTQQMLDWYVAPNSRQAMARVVYPLNQSVQVDYPIMCYKGFVPDNRELILVNLADKQNPQKIMHLYDMQFICFVGHNFSDREAKIGMLCLEGNLVRLCWLVCRQPYKKRKMEELDHLMIHKVPITFNVPILNEIGDIVKAEYVSSPGYSGIDDSLFGAIVIQTKNELYYSSNASGKYDRLTGGLMKPLTLQRGYNNVFYFVQAIGEADSIVNEMKLTMTSGEWDYQLLEVHKVSEGRVIALELDPENIGKTDSAYNFKNALIEQVPDVYNMIYVIDDKENMWKLRQKGDEESGARYEVVEEKNLTLGKELTLEFNEYKQKEFNRLSITERCITLNDKNFNFFNGHFWKLDIRRKSDAAANLQEEEKDEAKSFSDITAIQSMPWTSRQLIDCIYQDYDSSKKLWHSSHAFITKLQPGSRRQDLVGLRGLRDMDSVNLISNDQYLMKFKGADLAGIQDYWTIIDKFGQIMELPTKAKDLLIWSNFSCGQSRQKSTGVTIIIRGGQQRVISFDADVTYVERKMTKIEFDRKGDVISIKQFQKKLYDDKMRENIIKDLMEQQIPVKGRRNPINEKSAENIANTLKYQDDVLCTKEGDLYRIASIVDQGFDDENAVNPMADDDGNLMVESDKLNMGIFIVKSKAQRAFEISDCSKLVKDNKELKIVLFLCKTERDRSQLNAAGFAICGKYLCWSYPEEKVVHTLNMEGMNKTGVEEATKAVGNAISRTFGNLLKGKSGTMGSMSLINASLEDEKDGGNRAALKKGKTSKKPPPAKKGSKVQKAGTKVQASNSLRGSMKSPPPKRPVSRMKSGNLAINDSMVSTVEPLIPRNKSQPENDDNFMPAQGNELLMPQDTTMFLQDNLMKQPSFGSFGGLGGLNNRASTMLKEQSSVERIRWAKYTTKAIDLRVMCEVDSDKLSMIVAEVPKTMQFSISKERLADDPAARGYSYKQGLRDNLLQVTIKDRTIIYDLEPSTKKMPSAEEEEKKAMDDGRLCDPQELFLLNATSHFIPLHKYVEVGVKIVKVKEAPNNEGFLIDQIITNRCKDSCLYRQDRLVYTDKPTDQLQARPPICKGIFKKFAEIDLQELNRIQDKVTRQARLDNIDFQTILSSFNGHTAFSIFAKEVKYHEQVLIQVQEGDWHEEEQEDETFLENNELRRLFRILTLPTPDILEKSLKDQAGNPPTEPVQTLPIRQQQSDQILPTEPAANDDDDLIKNNEPTGQNQASAVDAVIMDFQKEGLESVLQKSLYTKSSRIKDCLLQIANKCEDCSITSFCANQDDFQKLLKNLSAQAIELIQESFVSTPFTKMIVNVPWGPEVPMITFRASDSLLTLEQCENQIQEILTKKFKINENEFTKAQVDVRLLDLSWLLADRKNFIHFVGTLKDASNDQIFTTELISTLLDNFWEENFSKILWKCLLPWTGYAFAIMWFFVQSLKEGHSAFVTLILGLICLVGLFYQISIEYRQNAGAGSALEYFMSAVNLLDVFQVTTSCWIIVMGILHVEFPSYETQRVIAAMATFCLWIKVLDWCKLFGPTSFFVRLILETISDIKYFMIIFVVALMMFGMPMYILQLNRTGEYEDAPIVNEVFGGFWPLNAFYNQYMLALGDFDYGNFESGPQTYLCYLLFLSATFFTQITFLNMLIALMGDTFAKVMEQKEQFGLQTKLQIMSDYTALVLDSQQDQDPECYMFVITQKTEGTDDPNAAWEGNLSVIKKIIEKGLASLQKNMDRKLNLVQQQNMESKTRDMMNDKDSRGQYLRIMEKFANVDNRFNAIDIEKTDRILEIVRTSQQQTREGMKELSVVNETMLEQQSEMRDRSRREIQQFQIKSKEASEHYIREFENLKTIQNDLVRSQEAIKQAITEQSSQNQPGAGAQSQGIDSSNAEGISAQLIEANKAIAASANSSNEAITKLSEQQERMLQQINTLEGRHGELAQTIIQNKEQSDSFFSSLNNNTDELKSKQDQMVEELRELKNSQIEFQNSVREQISGGGGNQDQIMSSMQEFMQQVQNQLREQQQQMQSEIMARQESDKQEILSRLQGSSQ